MSNYLLREGEAISKSSFDFNLVKNIEFKNCRINKFLKGIKFRNCVFSDCDFKEGNFHKLSFENVTFINCLFYGLVISNSSFISCEVVGEFLGAIFTKSNSISSFFGKKIPLELNLRNSLINGVSFQKVDISDIEFPLGENYILIRNPKEVFERALEVNSRKDYNEFLKGTLNKIITNIYLNKNKKGMGLDFVDLNTFKETNDEELGIALFKLIHEVS